MKGDFEKIYQKIVKKAIYPTKVAQKFVRLETSNHINKGIKKGQKGYVELKVGDQAFVAFNHHARGIICELCDWNELKPIRSSFKAIFKDIIRK